ncbi:GNAT family N-acetyltransferase [bacterium]|nr:MAG: GNAT family N-acetyltransferase [bacterium]
MNVRSLGYRTDLLFTRFEGEVTDRGDYLVARTPKNPTFHWGNFLLFDRAPQGGDFERWTAVFQKEFSGTPELNHVAIGWNEGEPGHIEPFLKAGYELNDNVVLSTDAVHRPPKFCEEAELRPIREDWEWEAVAANKVLGRDPIYEEASYISFSNRQTAMRRRMVAEGLGLWLGAFLDGRLAGDLGIFVFEGLGRFQAVDTHPDFRRRGVCGALVHHAATHALNHMGAQRLVMVADAHYHAAKIYESVGFQPTERQIGVSWWPREPKQAQTG